MNKPFFITTALPYVNGMPHIGYALELVQADVVARFERIKGNDVVFNIGTDEHGQKIFQKATEEGSTPQEYCDRMSGYFRIVKETLDISYTNFIRTTDEHHVKAAQEFWRRCEAAGDIYKKQYQTKYCVGCEMEKTDSDLDHGKCSDHPNMEIQIIEEENYFFRFSKYQQALLDLYDERTDFVVPANRLVEIKNFVAGGLQDFSISRLTAKMSWGIPVPGDDTHVMYVWFDALVNYISTLGWPDHITTQSVAGEPEERVGLGNNTALQSDFERFWPALQIAGKDNLRQQSAMWQAMLLSAGIEPSKQILIHGHVIVGGQKMSKSLGNVISPDELIERFGTDGTRYLLLSSGNLENDPDLTMERMTEKYNADLANGLGNLVSRVVKLSEQLREPIDMSMEESLYAETKELSLLNEYKFSDSLELIWLKIREANKFIDENKPWELVKTDQDTFEKVMLNLYGLVGYIGLVLKPVLPLTSEKIEIALKIRKVEPLFQRIK